MSKMKKLFEALYPHGVKEVTREEATALLAACPTPEVGGYILTGEKPEEVTWPSGGGTHRINFRCRIQKAGDGFWSVDHRQASLDELENLRLTWEGEGDTRTVREKKFLMK